MPVRRRSNRRSNRLDFPVSAELAAAFRGYIESDRPAGWWVEHWALHDLLDEVGALALPLCPPCCWHPRDFGIRWEYAPDAVAVYRRLADACSSKN